MKFTSIGHLDRDAVYQLVKENFTQARKNEPISSGDELFHHNTSYDNITSVLQNGLLSFNRMKSLGINKSAYQAIDNVNGEEYISVSRKEHAYRAFDFEYNYDSPFVVDFVIRDEIRKRTNVMRNTTNYVNEYLVLDEIPIEYIKLMSVRFMRMAKEISERDSYWSLASFIKRYNQLIDALPLLEDKNIPLIENSEEIIHVDKSKLKSLGKLK